MEQQTTVRRSSLPDPFDDVNTNPEVRILKAKAFKANSFFF